MFRMVAQLLPCCATEHPDAQRDVLLRNRLDVAKLCASGYSATTPFHSAAAGRFDRVPHGCWVSEVHWVRFPRWREAKQKCCHLLCRSQCIVTHLNGAASADANKAFLHLIYSLNAFAKPVRLSICMNRQFLGNISYPVAQPGSSIRVWFPNRTVLYCPAAQLGSSIHIRLPNWAVLYCPAAQPGSSILVWLPNWELYSCPVA